MWKLHDARPISFAKGLETVISQITALTDIIRNLENCMDTNGVNGGGQQQSRLKGKGSKNCQRKTGNTAGPMATVVTTATPAKTRRQDTSTTPPFKASKAEVTKTATRPPDGVEQ